MPIFDQLSYEAEARGLKFLVIGGHAVMRHGFLRATADIDLLVNKEARSQWEQLVQQLGYTLFHDGGTFLQLTPAAGVGWELDLMLVPASTFERMLADAQPTRIEEVAVLTPKLDHLLALKLHALKHGQGMRLLKDLEDVVQLVKANQLDVDAVSFRQLFEKYGSTELYERVVKACAE